MSRLRYPHLTFLPQWLSHYASLALSSLNFFASVAVPLCLLAAAGHRVGVPGEVVGAEDGQHGGQHHGQGDHVGDGYIPRAG